MCLDYEMAKEISNKDIKSRFLAASSGLNSTKSCLGRLGTSLLSFGCCDVVNRAVVCLRLTSLFVACKDA